MKTRLALSLSALSAIGALVLAACARAQEPDDAWEMPRPPPTAAPVEGPRTPPSFTVGVAGGTFTVGELTIDVPGGAVSEPIDVRVDVEPTRPDGYAIDGNVYRFAPAGLHFARPISISFPAGAERHGVHWTVDGSESTFEPLETTVADGRVIAHPTHFSGGFVGAATTSVSCVVKRRVQSASGCSQTTTIENGVHLWLAAPTASSDIESGITSDSSGMRALYLTPPGSPTWTAADTTRTRYVGAAVPAKEYILRAGNVVDVFEDAARSGTAIAGCAPMPLIEVSCRGTTTLGKPSAPPPPPPVDAGASDTGVDAAPDATTDAGSDAETDAAPPEPPTGVTCLTTRRTTTAEVCNAGVCTCPLSTTTESNVKFWLVRPNAASVDTEGAVATSSPGIRSYANSGSSVDAPIFLATDGTHARYVISGDPAKEYIDRSLLEIEVHVDAARIFGVGSPGACKNVPNVEVHCTGTTTLGK